MTGVSIVPQQVQLKFSQYAMDRIFRKLFPAEYTAGMKFPVLEDLVNREPFTTYFEFLDARELDSQTGAAPQSFKNIGKNMRAAATNNQRGTLFSAAALPQMVALGLQPDQHFQEAINLADEKKCFPMEAGGAVALDLRCAADQMAKHRTQLHSARSDWFKAFKELSSRMQPVTAHLRKSQHIGPARVAHNVYIGFIGELVMIMYSSCQLTVDTQPSQG